MPGCTVLIYDQTCAAEKRRRRKRGQFPDPDKRVVINELVCEGCGDCGVKSNCVSVQPLETEFGRKRTIDQSSCNKDFSCVKGFCPSFVTVEGAKLKRGRGVDLPADTAALPAPVLPAIDKTFGVIVTGIGGTGIVTIGAILGMAANLEGKGVGIIDMAGLAQKGGAVASHIRFANRPEDIHAIRVAARSADLVLGGDIVVAGSKKVLAAVKPGTTAMIINLAEMLPGEFTRNPEFSLPSERLKRTIASLAGPARTHFVNASALSTALLGQSIGANMFMLGYAYQLGTLPISAEAIEKAIEMNGEAVAMNYAAFRWGRRAAVDLAGVEALARPAADAVDPTRRLSESFDEMVARRIEFLTAYQDAAYADRYRRRVAAAKAAEAARAPGKSGFAEAVARYLFKLMAYKDEYEVARLYSDPAFLRQVRNEVDGDNLRLTFHLAPPLLARRDKTTGEPRKMTFGPWMMQRVPAAREAQIPARHRVRPVRLHRRAPHRAAARARLRSPARRIDRAAFARQSSSRRRPRRDPGEDPRLRSGQDAPPHRRQGRRGGAARPVPCRPGGLAQGGGVRSSQAISRTRHALRRTKRRKQRCARRTSRGRLRSWPCSALPRRRRRRTASTSRCSPTAADRLRPRASRIANGMHDYLTLLNERDGGIGGVKLDVEECETGFDTKKGVECYEAVKAKKPVIINPVLERHHPATRSQGLGRQDSRSFDRLRPVGGRVGHRFPVGLQPAGHALGRAVDHPPIHRDAARRPGAAQGQDHWIHLPRRQLRPRADPAAASNSPRITASRSRCIRSPPSRRITSRRNGSMSAATGRTG